MDQLTAQFSSGAPLDLVTLLINLGLGVGLSLVLRWHFERFGSSHSNREEFAAVFPFILLTTTLIITVVKSSLALSLGLVGALSIVRFRTPIKEPEELAYLFLAIAMGLGLGADQAVPTLVAGLAILGVMAVLKYTRRGREKTRLYLSIDLAEEGPGRLRIDALNEVISQHAAVLDVRRVDSREGRLEATYFVDLVGTGQVSELIDGLRGAFPGIGVSFIDQSRIPSI